MASIASHLLGENKGEAPKPLDVLMVGTGEYTTGFVGGGASGSDKKVGVVGLTLFDLRRRGKVGKLSMVGTSGFKFPAIRTLSPFSNSHNSFKEASIFG
jgi:D-galacturonate reductase